MTEIKLAKPILINEYNSLKIRYTEKDILAERKQRDEALEKEKKRAEKAFLGGAVVACDVIAGFDEPTMMMEVVKSMGEGMEAELLRNGNPETIEKYKQGKGN